MTALALGIEVTRYGILDARAARSARRVPRRRQRARGQADRDQRRAPVPGRDREPAHGEAASQVESARSDSGSAVLRAEGESNSLKMRETAFREHRVGTKRRLYLETMEEVLARSRKIIRPAWKGSGGIDLWVMNGSVPAPVSDVIRGGDVRAQQEQKGGGAEQPPPTEE